jgi:hypothetical protein
MWRAAPAAHLASRTSGVAPAVHCVPRASARWQRALRPLPRVAALSAQQLSAPQSMASAPAAALALRLAQPSLAGPAPKSRAARSPGGKLRPIEARRAEAFTFPARRRRPGVSAALADRGGLQSQQRPLRLQPGSAAIAGPGRRARRAAAPPLRAATMWRAALAAYPASRTSGAAPATRGVPRAAAPTAQQRLAPKGPAPQNMVAAPAAAMALRLDMAWRATSAFAASAAQAGGEPRRPETGAAAFRPEHPHPAGGAGAPPATQRSHQPVVTLLDPAVAERLVEDVLRRAEQRMRIGRERRGL